MNHAFSTVRPPAKLHSRWLQMLSFCATASPERLLSEASEWAISLRQSIDQSSPKTDFPTCDFRAFSNRTVRVGILCHGLADRGLRDWLPDCLGKLDVSQMQCFLFCDSSVHSEVGNTLAKNGCHLEVASQLSDSDLASRIRERQIDVLIDMIGHGLTTRLQVIAQKTAPLQVSWCAFPMSSGLTQMDFVWSDHIVIPNDKESNFSEKVVRFPSSSLCFQPSCSIDLRPSAEVTSPGFRCGFLGSPKQISDPLIEAMQSIMFSIPDAELVFIGYAYRDNAFQSELREKFSNSPELTDRVRFECFESDKDELNSYQQLDVTLDAFLVSSPQRSFESLWMGVPVVTLLGDRMSARGTASILHTLSYRDWIANTPVEYVNAVKQLAESRSQWRERRAQIRAELLASPMCDTAAIARNFQNAVSESLRLSLSREGNAVN